MKQRDQQFTLTLQMSEEEFTTLLILVEPNLVEGFEEGDNLLGRQRAVRDELARRVKNVVVGLHAPQGAQYVVWDLLAANLEHHWSQCSQRRQALEGFVRATFDVEVWNDCDRTASSEGAETTAPSQHRAWRETGAAK